MFKLKMVDNGTKDVKQLTAAGRACDMVGNSWHLEGTPGGPSMPHPLPPFNLIHTRVI